MNKKGQDYAAVNAMEYAFLVILAIFFSVAAVNGVEEQKINQFKADNLAMAIDSVFLLKDDAHISYNLGKAANVKAQFKMIEVYESDVNEIGKKEFTIDEKFDFAEDINGKKENIIIRKEGNRVVLS